MEHVDRLDAMLERFTVRARQFHLGPLCDIRRFEALPGRGFLHILRAGTLVVTDGPATTTRVVAEPSVLFYPRPHEHVFHARSDLAVDLACATLEFDGGGEHPLVRALPDVITVPIADVPGLDLSLELLFDEIDQFRCGHRHVIDRLFEITLLKLIRWMLDHPSDLGLPPGLFGGLADPQIARALARMHEEPGHPWTLDALGASATMSRSAFAARFRELVGTTRSTTSRRGAWSSRSSTSGRDTRCRRSPPSSATRAARSHACSRSATASRPAPGRRRTAAHKTGPRRESLRRRRLTAILHSEWMRRQ